PHKTAIASRSCIGCHMPQVAASATLRFTNHWIGVYDPNGRKLAPFRRMTKALQPASPVKDSLPASAIPADPSTLSSVYEKALTEREKETGPTHPKVARAAESLGLFLTLLGNNTGAVPPLRRALAIDEQNADASI